MASPFVPLIACQKSNLVAPAGTGTGVAFTTVAVGAAEEAGADDAEDEAGGFVGSGALVGATLDATELLAEDEAGGGALVGSGVGVAHAATNTSRTIKNINVRFILNFSSLRLENWETE